MWFWAPLFWEVARVVTLGHAHNWHCSPDTSPVMAVRDSCHFPVSSGAHPAKVYRRPVCFHCARLFIEFAIGSASNLIHECTKRDVGLISNISQCLHFETDRNIDDWCYFYFIFLSKVHHVLTCTSSATTCFIAYFKPPKNTALLFVYSL